MNPLDALRNGVRKVMRQIAGLLNQVSAGRLTPNMVTIAALLAHIVIALFIAQGKHGWAAVLLIIFGLFDALDGELARLQKKASNAGMVLDASTDRFKEVLLYVGSAYSFILSGDPYSAVWAVLACGASTSVSYVKAKGETAVKDSKLTPNEINRIFADGFLRLEVRMAVLTLGLLTNNLDVAIVFIAVFAAFTAIGRLIRIMKKLS